MMVSNRAVLVATRLLLVAAPLVACGEGSDVAAHMLSDATVVVADGGPANDAGCLESSALSCACDDGGTGTRTCRAGTYGACEGCTVLANSQSRCVAGRYEGTFEMSNYRSGPGGFCGITAELKEGVAQGKWDFSLSQSGSLEFYTVGGGCLSAGSAGGTPPLKAKLSGTVDCATGLLTGELEGTYSSPSVCTLGLIAQDSFFKGTMSGTFNPATNSFVDTMVEWQEPPVAIPPQPGGSGTWSAVLNPSADVPVGDVDCLGGVVFPDDKFPASP